MSPLKGTPTPDDQDDGFTYLQEAVLGLLEAAAIPQETNDQIIALIAKAEYQQTLATLADDLAAEVVAGLLHPSNAVPEGWIDKDGNITDEGHAAADRAERSRKPRR